MPASKVHMIECMRAHTHFGIFYMQTFTWLFIMTVLSLIRLGVLEAMGYIFSLSISFVSFFFFKPMLVPGWLMKPNNHLLNWIDFNLFNYWDKKTSFGRSEKLRTLLLQTAKSKCLGEGKKNKGEFSWELVRKQHKNQINLMFLLPPQQRGENQINKRETWFWNVFCEKTNLFAFDIMTVTAHKGWKEEYGRKCQVQVNSIVMISKKK